MVTSYWLPLIVFVLTAVGLAVVFIGVVSIFVPPTDPMEHALHMQRKQRRRTR
jgi:hypothetical protein